MSPRKDVRSGGIRTPLEGSISCYSLLLRRSEEATGRRNEAMKPVRIGRSLGCRRLRAVRSVIRIRSMPEGLADLREQVLHGIDAIARGIVLAAFDDQPVTTVFENDVRPLESHRERMAVAVPGSAHGRAVVAVVSLGAIAPMSSSAVPIAEIGPGELIGRQLLGGFRRGRAVDGRCRRRRSGQRDAAEDGERGAKKQDSFHDDLPEIGNFARS